MIDPSRLTNQLKTLQLRASGYSDAHQWGTGQLAAIPEKLLPSVPEGARTALTRLAGMTQSIGARIVSTIKFGTLGEVNWGEASAEMDALLKAQDLDSVADHLLEDSLYSGLMVGINRRDAERLDTALEPLIGFKEPIYDKDSPTRVTGMIHAWLEYRDGTTEQVRWSVRVYDFGERTMLEWRDLTRPERTRNTEPTLIVEPSAEFPEGAPMPRYTILERGPDWMPLGLIRKNLGIIQSDWSSQIRGDRAEENTAFPQLKIKGEVEDGTNERSTSHIIRLLEDGDAGFILPGDLAQIHAHHDRKLERIREDTNMPGGFLARGNPPSGEALREANAKFINMCKTYARRLSRVLSELVQDLADANGLGDAPEVSVSINREFEKDNEIQRLVLLYREGLLDFGAAVRAASIYVPTWTDDAIEAFIEREEAAQEPNEVIPGALNG